MNILSELEFLEIQTKNRSIPANAFAGVGHSLRNVQVGKDQEKAQSEKDSHSKNRGGKKPN